MGLEKYKLDKAFTDGVDIYLDAAPDVVFRVRLPSQYNRAYSQALYGAMDWSVGDDGQVKPGGSLLTTRYAQEDAFIEHCLLSQDGEPVPESFRTDYPLALAELMEKAAELANDIQERVADTVKKSSASSTGSADGLDARSFMPSLNDAAG